MALPFLQSKAEESWDRFSRVFGGELKSASAAFARRTGRRVRLGSPVRLVDARGDVFRAPIEVGGAEREFAVGYLFIEGMDGKLNKGRLRALADEAVRLAEPWGEGVPDKPGRAELRYP